MGSPSHLGRGVCRLSSGRRSRGLQPGGVDGMPLRGPPLRLVFLEGVVAGLNAPQTASVTDVHLLGGHLLAARPLEARAAYARVRPTAGATVLAGGLAVRLDATVGSWSQSPTGAALLTSTDVWSGEPPAASGSGLAVLPAVHSGPLRLSGGALRGVPWRVFFPVRARRARRSRLLSGGCRSPGQAD